MPMNNIPRCCLLGPIPPMSCPTWLHRYCQPSCICQINLLPSLVIPPCTAPPRTYLILLLIATSHLLFQSHVLAQSSVMCQNRTFFWNHIQQRFLDYLFLLPFSIQMSSLPVNPLCLCNNQPRHIVSLPYLLLLVPSLPANPLPTFYLHNSQL